MSYRLTEWPLLLATQPELVRKRLLNAYSKAGNVKDAARALGLSLRSFHGYCKNLGVKHR